MKFYILIAFLSAIFMIIIPAAALTGEKEEKKEETPMVSTETVATAEDSISVFMTATETILTMEKLEYLVGVLACEMPASYHEEALKAQAIACNTYSLYMKNNPDKNLLGADISDSSETHQGYITLEERKIKWGDKFDEYENKLRSVVEEVQNTVITYNDEPIIASFFAICPGKTENSADIFGQSLPYLKSVTSDGDKLSPDYSKMVNLTEKEFSERLEKLSINDKPDDPTTWIGETQTTEAGTVKTIKICGREIKGSDFRKAFNLRSSSFSVVYSDGSFTIKTVGYGHFVGMSQYGADYMARQGATHKEILKHYYTGVKISDV